MKQAWILFRTEVSNVWYFYSFQNPFESILQHPIAVLGQERWFKVQDTIIDDEEIRELNSLLESKKRVFKIKGQPQRFVVIERGTVIIDN